MRRRAEEQRFPRWREQRKFRLLKSAILRSRFQSSRSSTEDEYSVRGRASDPKIPRSKDAKSEWGELVALPPPRLCHQPYSLAHRRHNAEAMSAPPRVISPPHQFDIEVTPTSSTLAELILTHISPPGSPASLSSAPSRSRTDSVDESSDEGGNWSSDEHEHSIGTGLERGGVGRRRREEAELVMPSMNLLNPSEFEGNEGVSSSIGQRSRLLLVGRSEEERQTLARLLVGKQGATNDLSQSILSGFASTRSGSNESTAGAIEGVEVIGEDEWMIIYQAVDGGMRGEELADLLERPSRRLERMLNPCFPATVGLESHLNRLGDEEIDMCLFLFSSRELYFLSLSFLPLGSPADMPTLRSTDLNRNHSRSIHLQRPSAPSNSTPPTLVEAAQDSRPRPSRLGPTDRSRRSLDLRFRHLSKIHGQGSTALPPASFSLRWIAFERIGSERWSGG